MKCLPEYAKVSEMVAGLPDLLACKTCGAVVVPMYEERHDEFHRAHDSAIAAVFTRMAVDRHFAR